MTRTIATPFLIFFYCITAFSQLKENFICVEAPTSRENNARSIAAKYLVWDNQKVLKVRFLNGNSTLQDTVKFYAERWAKHGNFSFHFVEKGSADIRIYFMPEGLVSWSYIGKQAAYAKAEKPTMVLTLSDSSSTAFKRRIILHEFGHALGLLHEHQHLNHHIPWDTAAVYDYFSQIGWSQGLIDYYILSKYSPSVTQYCAYDTNSVMHYPIPSFLTLGNFSVASNSTLSKGDTSFIKKLYPISGTRNFNNLCDTLVDTIATNTIAFAANPQNSFDGNLKIYPNPFESQLNITFRMHQKTSYQLEIFDSHGRRVFQRKEVASKGHQIITLNSTIFQQKGVYFYKLLAGNEVKSGKLIRM